MTFGLVLTTLLSFSQSATVVDIIVESESHNVLETAVVQAGLVDALSDTTTTFTVFAPTDDAFYMLPEGTLDAVLADNELLTSILTYHVVGGTALSTDLVDGTMVETLNGGSVTVTIDTNGVFINDAQVIVADIVADNGIVHVIDAVLLPPTEPVVTAVWDWIESSEVHNYLEAAVIAGGLQDTLEGEGTFTVFAPTDDAFMVLADELGVEVEQLLELPDLTEILMYHVLGTTVMSTDLYDGLEATTLGGGTLTIGVGETVTVNGTATVVLADLEAQNGVVHVIDSVLLDNTPNSIGEIQPTDVKYDGFYYNIMGQRFDSILDIPFGSVYIYNGKKCIMTQE